MTVIAAHRYKCLHCGQDVILDNTEVTFDDARCICLNCIEVLPARFARKRADLAKLNLALEQNGVQQTKNTVENLLQMAIQSAERLDK